MAQEREREERPVFDRYTVEPQFSPPPRRAFLHSKWPTAGGTADGAYPWLEGSRTFPTLLPGQGTVSLTFGCNRFIPGFAVLA